MARRLIVLVAGVIGALSLGAAVEPRMASATERVDLQLDRATVIRIPEGSQTLIVGNPMIADVSMQRNGVMVLTGKSFGETNLIALDSRGQMISETTLRVSRARAETVVVFRGAESETYACTPHCRPALALGDSEKHFGRAGAQVTTRNQLATTGGGAAGGR